MCNGECRGKADGFLAVLGGTFQIAGSLIPFCLLQMPDCDWVQHDLGLLITVRGFKERYCGRTANGRINGNAPCGIVAVCAR